MQNGGMIHMKRQYFSLGQSPKWAFELSWSDEVTLTLTCGPTPLLFWPHRDQLVSQKLVLSPTCYLFSILIYHGYNKAILHDKIFFRYLAIKLLKRQSIYLPESVCRNMLPSHLGGLPGFTQQQGQASASCTGKYTANTKLPHCT